MDGKDLAWLWRFVPCTSIGNHGTISTHCNCATRKTTRREVMESKQMMYAEGFLSCFWRTYWSTGQNYSKISKKNRKKNSPNGTKGRIWWGRWKRFQVPHVGPFSHPTWPGAMEIAVEPLATAVGFVHRGDNGITQSVEPTWWESWWSTVA